MSSPAKRRAQAYDTINETVVMMKSGMQGIEESVAALQATIAQLEVQLATVKDSIDNKLIVEIDNMSRAGSCEFIKDRRVCAPRFSVCKEAVAAMQALVDECLG